MSPKRTNLLIMMVSLLALAVLAAVNVATDDTATSDPVPAGPDQGEPGASSPPGSDATSTGSAAGAPQPPGKPPASQLSGVPVRLEAELTELGNLTGMTWNAEQGAFYAITQEGTVHRVAADLSGSDMVLDLTGEVTELLPGSERGLLGIAFDPRDGRMFLYFTDRGDDTNVVSYAMADGRPTPESRRAVLFVEQPGAGHKGGKLRFSDDGVLYVALGDGGGSRGRDAQDYTKLLGAILRIVPRLDADGYDIPADNPYATATDKRPEIFVKGLRNPWQFTFDPSTGDIYIADVGEDATEELDVVPAGTSGQNFGWYWYEGSTDRGIGGVPEGLQLTPPVFEYSHSEVGPAIIGGEFYWGTAIPQLRGAFVFADMTGPFFAMGDGYEVVRLDLGLSPQELGVLTSVVAGPDGELLLLTLRSGIFRLLPG